MSGLIGLVPPLIEGIFNLPNVAAQQRAYEEARAESLRQRQYATGLQGFDYETGQFTGGGLYGRVMPAYEALAGSLGKYSNAYYTQSAANRRYDTRFDPINTAMAQRESRGRIAGRNLVSGYNTLIGQSGDIGEGIVQDYNARTALGRSEGDRIVHGYAGRYGRGMRNIAASGLQERQDINAAFNRQQGSISQDLVSRGLTGTTIAPQLKYGLERERAGALGGLNERLLQQRTNLDAALSGDMLRAQAGQQAFGANLSGQALQARYGQQQIGNQLGLAGLQSMANTRAFNAGLSADTIGTQRDIAAGSLANLDQATATRLANAYAYNQLPLQADIGLTNSLVGTIEGQQIMYPGF